MWNSKHHSGISSNYIHWCRWWIGDEHLSCQSSCFTIWNPKYHSNKNIQYQVLNCNMWQKIPLRCNEEMRIRNAVITKKMFIEKVDRCFDLTNYNTCHVNTLLWYLPLANTSALREQTLFFIYMLCMSSRPYNLSYSFFHHC